MKTQFTFAELAKIFNQVERVETAVSHFKNAQGGYEEIDKTFDCEFAKYGYSFFNAPQELHDMFAEKCAAMENRDKLMRKAYKSIKDFGELIGIEEGNGDIVEEKVKSFIIGKYYWNAINMVQRVKSLALAASRRIANA